MLLQLDAHLYCDHCGGQFVVEIVDGERLDMARGRGQGLRGVGIDAAIDVAIRETQVRGGGFALSAGRRMFCPGCVEILAAGREEEAEVPA